MAIVLKGYGDATSCGCGCSGGCSSVTSNCNFVLRKFDYSQVSPITWLGNATEQDKECVANGNCNGSGADPCTGEGVIYGSGGGGGGDNTDMGCTFDTGDGGFITVVPCCSDISTCSGSTFYTSYWKNSDGSIYSETYSGTFTKDGVSYTVEGGLLISDAPPAEESAASPMSANISSTNEATTFDYGGNVIGTWKVPYTDESIDFDNIGVVDPTEEEAAQNLCKFSYNFNFTPEEGVSYIIISLPCDSAAYYPEVNLEPDGRAYFLARYNTTTQSCSINQTYILPPESESETDS